LTNPSSTATPPAQQASPAVITDALQPPTVDPAIIDAALKRFIDDQRLIGVSALVFERGKEVYFGTAGYADREARRPMRRDTLAQIWSMTKPVTGVALMQLWEQGKFRLDDPLSDYLPEFAQTKVYDGSDGAGNPRVRPRLLRR
jgi:CubicO group peptidase (beta-lactamase class C family)